MIKVALSGINGRMGQMLLKAVLAASDMELSAALGHSGSSAIGSLRDYDRCYGYGRYRITSRLRCAD